VRGPAGAGDDCGVLLCEAQRTQQMVGIFVFLLCESEGSMFLSSDLRHDDASGLTYFSGERH